MKAPIWAIGCALVFVGTSGLRADDFGGTSTLGPAVTPLARAASSIPGVPDNTAAPGTGSTAQISTAPNSPAPVNALRYPAVLPAVANPTAIAQTTAPAPLPAPAPAPVAPPITTPAAFVSAAGAAPVAPPKMDTKNLPMTSDPVMGAPSNVDGTVPIAPPSAPAAKSVLRSNPWRPIQTAFNKLADSKPAPTPPQVPRDPSIAPGSAAPSNPPYPPMSARADGVQPSTTNSSSSDYVEKPFAKSARMMSGEVPNEVVYGPPSGGGGCNCNPVGDCGPVGDSQICPNCGGWHHGSCCPNNPDGSCICERFACCMCKPYPDCSNGCVDFCHSWIFHEDDCWATSNHKCCSENCGPYPYGGCPIDGQGKGNGCGCGNCGPCVPKCPMYFSAEATILSRQDNVISQPLVNTTATDPNTMMTVVTGTAASTSDFNFDDVWRSGPKFVFGYSPTPKDAWELSYFGMNDWAQSESVTGTANLALPGDLGALKFFAGADLVNITYSSEVHDAELNYFWHYGDCKVWSWLGGFRYFRLDEDINLLSTVTGMGSSDYDARAINNLYGGQMGGRLHLCCHAFDWECTAKAGAFGNDIESRQFAGEVGGPTTFRDTKSFETHWAYVGEFDMNARYYFAKNWCATVGYSLMWVDGVALAPDQLDFTNVAGVSGRTINHDGQAFYQGVHVGVGHSF